MQYAICLSSQTTGSEFVFRFSRVSPTWTASVPSPHKFSKPVVSNSSKPWPLSSITIFLLESRTSKNVFFLVGRLFCSHMSWKERDSIFSTLSSLIIYLLIHLLIYLNLYRSHYVAQSGLRFTIIPLSHPFMYWEYSHVPIQPDFLHNLT